MKASEYKLSKYLSAEDIRKLCPGVIATEISDGPVIIINDQSHEAKTYTFNKIEEVIGFFSPKVNQHILIKNVFNERRSMSSGIILNKGNSIRVYDDKNQTMNKLWGHDKIEVDEECTLRLEFKSDDINKEYKKFVVRIYEPVEISSDTYKECDTIDKCIIKDVESNIKEITEKFKPKDSIANVDRDDLLR